MNSQPARRFGGAVHLLQIDANRMKKANHVRTKRRARGVRSADMGQA